MIDDPLFWVSAIIAVIITGISKGGFGGLALLAVPIMALQISPVQAAGIMLPILIVMDWVSVWSYRKHWDADLLKLLLPGAIAGIAAGGLLAGFVDDRFVLICVGLIAVGFAGLSIFKGGLSQDPPPRPHNKPLGMIAGLTAGFTSFLAHAGGPPFQAYAIPRGLEPRIYAGTAVMFFFVVNFVKLLPYALLGQFDRANLSTSLVLIPLAPIGVLIGVWLVKRINRQLFYRIMYVLIFIVGCKLLWDGFF